MKFIWWIYLLSRLVLRRIDMFWVHFDFNFYRSTIYGQWLMNLWWIHLQKWMMKEKGLSNPLWLTCYIHGGSMDHTSRFGNQPSDPFIDWKMIQVAWNVSSTHKTSFITTKKTYFILSPFCIDWSYYFEIWKPSNRLFSLIKKWYCSTGRCFLFTLFNLIFSDCNAFDIQWYVYYLLIFSPVDWILVYLHSRKQHRLFVFEVCMTGRAGCLIIVGPMWWVMIHRWKVLHCMIG